jgi:hypothetical protein
MDMDLDSYYFKIKLMLGFSYRIPFYKTNKQLKHSSHAWDEGVNHFVIACGSKEAHVLLFWTYRFSLMSMRLLKKLIKE